MDGAHTHGSKNKKLSALAILGAFALLAGAAQAIIAAVTAVVMTLLIVAGVLGIGALSAAVILIPGHARRAADFQAVLDGSRQRMIEADEAAALRATERRAALQAPQTVVHNHFYPGMTPEQVAAALQEQLPGTIRGRVER